MTHATLHRKGQMTLPPEIRDHLRVREGDGVEFDIVEPGMTVEPGMVVVRGWHMIPADQAWFWAESWQAGERRASEDIAAGRTCGPFDSAEDMFDALGVK
jgi:antitoxin PrlF